MVICASKSKSDLMLENLNLYNMTFKRRNEQMQNVNIPSSPVLYNE